MKLSKKSILIFAYIGFLIFSFFYVKKVLKEGDIKVESKTEAKTKEIKPVSVTLVIIGAGINETYTERMQNVDSIRDLFDTVAKNTGLTYDLTSYIDRITLDQINGVTPPPGYIWRVLADDQDVTENMGKTELVDNTTYRVLLVED